VENLVERKIRTESLITGCAIVSDGWSDTNRRPLINLLVTTPSGALFIKAVNCEGVTKGAEFVAKLLTRP
jgi:hypothetical protein